MRPVMLDTNAYSAFKRGNPDIIEIIQHSETIAISPIVLGELFAGFDNGKKADNNRKELHQFLSSSRIRLYQITTDTANYYAQIFTRLKKKGKPIPTNDMWISAQALEHGCFVCTYDKHFSEIGGLLIANKATDLSP